MGRIVGGPEVAHLDVAYPQGRIWREGDPVWYGDVPARHEAIPVRLRTADGEAGEVIAVVGRDTNLSTARTPSQLELNYLTTADDLAQMIADGTFPPPRHPGETTSAPRVGDGLVRLDAGGKVTYASPNAQSAYRRLGLRRAPGRRGPGRAAPPAGRRPAGGHRRRRTASWPRCAARRRPARRSTPAARPCSPGRCR